MLEKYYILVCEETNIITILYYLYSISHLLNYIEIYKCLTLSPIHTNFLDGINTSIVYHIPLDSYNLYPLPTT